MIPYFCLSMKINANIKAYILSLFLVLKLFFYAPPSILYFVDQEQFVALFCENTNRPQLKCNGKCQLKKMTKKNNDDKKSPEFKIDSTPLVFILEGFRPSFLFTSISIHKVLCIYVNNYIFLPEYFIDHPPQF